MAFLEIIVEVSSFVNGTVVSVWVRKADATSHQIILIVTYWHGALEGAEGV